MGGGRREGGWSAAFNYLITALRCQQFRVFRCNYRVAAHGDRLCWRKKKENTHPRSHLAGTGKARGKSFHRLCVTSSFESHTILCYCVVNFNALYVLPISLTLLLCGSYDASARFVCAPAKHHLAGCLRSTATLCDSRLELGRTLEIRSRLDRRVARAFVEGMYRWLITGTLFRGHHIVHITDASH